MSPDYETLKKRCERLELLYQVGNRIHSTLESEKALGIVLQEALRGTGAETGAVRLLNPNTGLLEIHCSEGLSSELAGPKLRIGEGLIGWVARAGRSVRLGDAPRDPRHLPGTPVMRSELAVPLEVEGELRGVLNVGSDRHDAFGPDDQTFLEELACQTAQVIRNTWRYEQLRFKAALSEALISVSQTLASTVNLDEALHTITREACHLVGAKMSSLRLVGSDPDLLELRANYGAGPAYVAGPALSIAHSLMGTVMRRKKPLQVENVQTSGRYQHIETARQEGLVSLLSVPLVYQGKATGTLNVYTGTPHPFSNEEIRILMALAELSAIAIEKARLYERLVDLEEQTRQNEKLSALGLLAAEVAHEIRNPLTVMQMLFHSLQLDFPESDPRSKDAEMMRSKMGHLNRIVEKVLAFAKNTEPQPDWIDLNRVLDDLGLLTRHKLTQQNIRLRQKWDPHLPSVWGDANQLEQVFLNLTLNAVEAMPSGGNLEIVTRRRRTARKGGRPREVAIDFIDSGPGMTPQERKRAFTSLLSSSKHSGSGLGLPIVARLLEAHRGTIRLRSRPGQGTKVTVILPVAPPTAGRED